MFSRHFCAVLRYRWSVVSAILAVALSLAGCGGGGGGGGSDGPKVDAPQIIASVISFPTTSVPPGLILGDSVAGSNTGISVAVLDNSSGNPINNATVVVNGTTISYDAATQDYEGGIALSPAGNITVTVTLAGVSYSVTGKQFTSYPTILSPASGATWSSEATNLAAWSGVSPTKNSLYAIGLLDNSGELVWPSGGAIQTEPTTTSSLTINANALSAGNRFVIVGLVDLIGIPGAAANSSLVFGGFNYVPIAVTKGSTASLLSITITPSNPTVSLGRTLQLRATGTYSDTTTEDLSSQVFWSSTDTSRATVTSAGLLTGVANGSATINAMLGGVTGGTSLSIFQPTPSPVPPLSQSVTYQVDYYHTGHAVFPNPLVFPSSPAWSVTLNGDVSYPLVANGKVYVATYDYLTTVSQIYALNEQTGNVVWGPVTVPDSYGGTLLTYDNDHLFGINQNGLLVSYDAETGNLGWSSKVANFAIFQFPLTAVDGVIYLSGGGAVYAADEANGSIMWTASVLGATSSPTVTSDGVFVAYSCQVYKFDPMTGVPLWHYSGSCTGGGGWATSYANGLLYARDPIESTFNSSFPGGLIFDAAKGSIVGTFTATMTMPIPAFADTTGFYLNAGTLQGRDLNSSSVLWSFAGDGNLVNAPMVVNQAVFVASSSGNVYAVDASTGTQLWSSYTGSTIADRYGNEGSSFGAGDGYLVVRAGNKLSGWKLF